MLNVSSAFQQAVKQGSRNIDAVVGIGDKAVTNLVANGDFSKGSASWKAGASTLLSTDSTTATITGLGVQVYQYLEQSGLTIPSGDKVYARVKAKAMDTLCTRLMLYGNAGGTGYQFANQYTPVKGTQYTMSGVITPLATLANLTLIGYYADTTTSKGSVIQVQDVTLIDLTATFGAGNEPTKEYMDELIAKVGWFDGTKNIPDTFLDTSSLTNFSIDSSLGNGNLPSIGSTISNKLTLTVINDGTLPQTIIGKAIRPYVAIEVAGGYEWVKLGEFYADYDGVDIGKLETTLEAFDKMAYYMGDTYTAMEGLAMTVQGVLNDLESNYGAKFASQTGLPTTSKITVTPTGSVRQVISDMASLMSTNATIDGDGCVKFVFMNTIDSSTFSLGLDNYSEFKLQPDKLISFTELISSDGNNEVPWGNTSGYALAFQNDQVRLLDDVKAIYNRIFPINYYAYTMKAQGMPHIELGDVIRFTYLKLDGSESTINIPILKHKLIFQGGLISEFSASAPQQQTTSVSVTSGSSLADAVDVTYGDLAQAIEIASKQITGNQGGFVTTVLNGDNQPQELVISNTPDFNTADKIWRWNAGGLGYSEDGYNGSYGLALTADGQIVADKVTVGILNANIIKAGIIEDVKNQSWINLEDGTFNFGNGKLVWDGSSFDINFADTSVEDALDSKVGTDTFAPFQSNISFDNGIITLGKSDNPFSVNVTNQAVEFIDTGTTGGTLNLTAITGNGTSVTCTYASQPVTPYQVGGYAQIAKCSVGAYNGTWLITSCTKTQVVLTCTATGTVSSGFGTVEYGSSPNTVAYINGQKMYIKELQVTSSMQVGNHQITKYDSDITLIKYAG